MESGASWAEKSDTAFELELWLHRGYSNEDTSPTSSLLHTLGKSYKVAGLFFFLLSVAIATQCQIQKFDF